MRLTKKKIEEILVVIIGSEGLTLIQNLIGKENVSEFDLAKWVKKDIKVVRRLLYTLYNHNLVSFTRKKDKQKGWYIYYWTLIPESIKYSYFKRKKNILARLKERLTEEEQELFFLCPNDCVRLNFDQSMEFEFHCPECGELINQDNGDNRKGMLAKKIADLENEIAKLTHQRREDRKKVNARAKKVEEKRLAAEEKKAAEEEKKKADEKKAAKEKVLAKKKVAKEEAAKKKLVAKEAAKKKLVAKEAAKKKLAEKNKLITKKKTTEKKNLPKNKKVVVKKKVVTKKNSVSKTKKTSKKNVLKKKK